MGVFVSPRRRRPQASRESIVTYSSARQGLNTYLLDNELGPEEVRDATNLKLVGKGILEPRPGTGFFYQADTATVRMLMDFYLSGNVDVLAITDSGFLTKKSGTSYTRILGASFASGARPEGAQIYGKMYFVDGVHPLNRTDGTTLLSYTKISSPTSLTVTKSSGTTGPLTYSYRVAHESDVGQTLASDPVTIASVPADLTSPNFITLSWTQGSPASYIKGSIIYGREAGAESYMDRVPSDVTSWIDTGATIPSVTVFPQAYNTTDGPVAKHIAVYKEKIVLGNLTDDDSTVMWSGSGPNIDKFHYSVGGGYYSIEKQSGDRWGVTGLAEKEGKIIVFKGMSIFQASLSYNSSLGINELSVTKLVDKVGCIASKTIQQVENSVMFVAYIPGRGLALAKLDYEPNILSSVLRFQPISARVQSVIDQVNFARIEECWAVYSDKKYHWFIPIGATSWICLVYDVERLAFVGPWTLTNAWAGTVHMDNDNKYHFLIGKSDGNVVELSDSYANDEGVNFDWTYLSKKEDFGMPFQLKTVIDGKVKLKNVSSGSVSVSYLTEGSGGLSETAKSVSVTANAVLAGWGSRRWAFNNKWGYQPSSSSSNSPIVYKYTLINKPNIISTQVRISGSGSRCQIISSQVRVRPQAIGNIPSTWR